LDSSELKYMFEKLAEVEKRYLELEGLMSDPNLLH